MCELIFDVLSDLSRVASVSRGMRPDFSFSNNLVPQIRIIAKRDNMLPLSPLANQVKSFPETFSTFQTAFLRKEKKAVKVASRKCGVVHDIKEQQVVPLITRETVFCQKVCELVFGFDILDLDFGVQVASVKNQSRATR